HGRSALLTASPGPLDRARGGNHWVSGSERPAAVGGISVVSEQRKASPAGRIPLNRKLHHDISMRRGLILFRWREPMRSRASGALVRRFADRTGVRDIK